MLSPHAIADTADKRIILGSEIETKIVSLDGKTSTLHITLRSSDPVLKQEPREVIAKLFPINLLLTIGKAEEMIVDLTDLQDALKALGATIARTVLWHLADRGFFKYKTEQKEILLQELIALFGPSGASIIDKIKNSNRENKKPEKSIYSRTFTFCTELATNKCYEIVNHTLKESPEFQFETEDPAAGLMTVMVRKAEGSPTLRCTIVPRGDNGSRAEFVLMESEDSGETREISTTSNAIHKFIDQLLDRIKY